MQGSLFHYSIVDFSSGLGEFLHVHMTIGVHCCDGEDRDITNSQDEGLFRFHYVNAAVALKHYYAVV